MILNVLERHRDKWVEDGECYRWATESGLPVIGIAGKTLSVPRIVCEQAHGLAPTDKPLALHDTPNGCIGGACVNGEHLRWGDRRENVFDEPIERRSEWAKRARETKGPEGRTKMRAERWTAKLAGEETYLTDKPCKRGHTGPHRTRSAECIECIAYRNSLRVR